MWYVYNSYTFRTRALCFAMPLPMDNLASLRTRGFSPTPIAYTIATPQTLNGNFS